MMLRKHFLFHFLLLAITTLSLARDKGVFIIHAPSDTMYNSRQSPKVSHFTGTDLVVEHVEKYVCPTMVSTDFTGKPPFEFKNDKPLLASTTTALLIGTIPDKKPEPVARTNQYGGSQVFYTSLGHPDDFKNVEFRKLLVNAVF